VSEEGPEDVLLVDEEIPSETGAGGTGTGVEAAGPDRPLPERVSVKPVFLVPSDAQGPSAEQVELLGEHMRWARRRYRELLDGQDTFELVDGPALVLAGAHEVAFYTSTDDGGAESAVLELFAHDGVDRFSCPYVYVVLFVGTGSYPAGGGRPLNGGLNTGAGIVVLAADNLTASPNFQATLQHELGHAFGLPHVDVYGYDMGTNPSLMSYNPAHATDGLTPSATPGELIPEDRRALALSSRLFPAFEPDPAKGPPPDYALKPMVFLGPMPLPGQPEYTGPSIAE
jgi:hypothetical protein